MSCYTFHIFNRQGVCQYYHEWARHKGASQAADITEDFKLLFGLCWSMKTFATAVDPKWCEGSLAQPHAVVRRCRRRRH
jgi:hypothetical protein